MMGGVPHRIFICLSTVVLILLMGCREKSLEVDAVVTDADGLPIAGALFYAEAFEENEGALAYVWGFTDEAGRARTVEGQPLKLPWTSSARLACAAFLPGMKPAAFIDRIGDAHHDPVSLTLLDTTATDLDFQPIIGKLGFPFETEPELAATLRDTAQRPLLKAFQQAYQVASDDQSIPMTPAERAKTAFLNDLVNSRD